MKVAICMLPDELQCSEVVKKMAQAQCLLDWHTTRLLTIPGGMVGGIHTSDRFSNIPLFRETPGGNWLLVTGVPIARNENLDKTLQKVVTGDYKSASRTLAALDGAFAAVFWDNSNQKMLVVTDFLGMQPLYIFRRSNTLLMATEVKGITASGLVDVKMDPAGWGSFLSFGHLIGDLSLVEGIRRTRPASIYNIDGLTGSVEQTTYWHWPAAKPERGLKDIDVASLVQMLRQDTMAYTQHTDQGTVLLSGGFDSRILLALLCEVGFSPDTLTVAHQDELFNADGLFASMVAKRFSVNYQKVIPPRDFFSSEAYLDYLIMSEVMVPSLYLFIAQVSPYIGSDIQAVWEGVATGNALETSHQPANNFNRYILKKCASRESDIWQTAFKIFKKRIAQNMYEEFQDFLQKERTKYSDDGFGVYEFMMRNRMRNRTGFSPFKVYTNMALPFTPGLSKAFWNEIGSMPYEIRSEGKLYFKIFLHYFQHIADIPIVSGTTLYFEHSRGTARWVASAIHWMEQHQFIKDLKKRLQKLLTGTWQYWPESELVPKVISAVNPEHPNLNTDEVRTLRRRTIDNSLYPTYYQEQQLVFYWQVWRWVMEGQLKINEYHKLGLMN